MKRNCVPLQGKIVEETQFLFCSNYSIVENLSTLLSQCLRNVPLCNCLQAGFRCFDGCLPPLALIPRFLRDYVPLRGALQRKRAHRNI